MLFRSEPPVSGPQAWKSGSEYKAGDEVLYGGALYLARKNTTSTPGSITGDWQEVTSEYRNFNLYNINDEVIYNGRKFYSRSSSNFNNLPGELNSPWQEITTEWRNFNVYKKGDTVVYNGVTYTANNSSGPGTKDGAQVPSNEIGRAHV